MRIGIDAAGWFNPRGYGRFLRELLPELVSVGSDHEFILYVEASGKAELETAAGRGVRVHAVDVNVAPTDAARVDGRRSLGDMRRFTRAVAMDAPDVMFFPSVYTYFSVPRSQRCVVTIHDAIPEAFPSETLGGLKNRLFWRLKMMHAISRSRIVLTVSPHAKGEIIRRLRVPESEIRVAVEAPSSIFRTPVAAEEVVAARHTMSLRPVDRYFAYVGGLNPHKLVPELVRRFAALPEEEGGPHLVIVGDHEGGSFTSEASAIRASISRSGVKDRVHFTGVVSDETLRGIYAGAVALLLPSRMEGFGLPAVEAAACGTPVMATTVSPLPELLEGGGIFVSPDEPASWTGAMSRLLEPEARAEFAAGASRKVAELSWRGTAETALAALEEAAG